MTAGAARSPTRPAWVAAACVAVALAVAAAGALVWAAQRGHATQPLLVDGFGLLQFNGDAGSVAWRDEAALGANVLFTWAQLEPREGDYDWSEFDALLATARASGKRLVPRVYTNVAGFGQATPDWVFDAGAESYADGEGPRQPVPADAVFSRKFADFLATLGQRYDGNESIEFIQTNAGMGAYGEMVWGDTPDLRPPGWSPDVQVKVTEEWIARWRDAFPNTHLALMENFIGYNIVERVARYAVDRKYYLQANDPNQAPESQRILAMYAPRTGIILEIENQGCRSATGSEYDAMIDKVFSYGFPIDYLVLCGQSLADRARMQDTLDRLRKHTEQPEGARP